MIISSATIIYFSPTGATKKIINSVIKGMDIVIKQQIDLTSLKVRNDVPASMEGEIVLIGVPVYAMGIPKILHSFLSNLQGNNKPAVLIAVYGNINEGISLYELFSFTENSGFKVIGAGSFIGEHSFSTEETPIAKCRPNSEDLNQAEEFGRNIMKKIGKINNLDDISFEIPQSKIRLCRAKILLFMRRIFTPNGAKIFAKPPVADLNICNHCGVCVHRCPIGAIDRDTLKIDKDQCLRCFCCVKACPQKARKIIYRPKVLVSKVLTVKNKVAKESKIYL